MPRRGRPDVHWGDARMDAMAGTPEAWRRQRLVVTPGLMLEAHDERHVVIVDTRSGARVKVSAATYRILSRFDAPRTTGDALGARDDDRIQACVRALLARKLLIDADDPLPQGAPVRRTAPWRFCNAPRWAAAPDGAGFAVLGVPYDLGGNGSCREAPSLIRQKSLDYAYLVDFDTRRPRGWFDTARGGRMLENVPIADAGDVPVIYGEKQVASFGRLRAAMDEVSATGCTPLILGGDRSLAFPVARHLCGARPLTVVLLAPESTMAQSTGEMVTVHDVGRRVAALDGVVSSLTVGLRAEGGHGLAEGVEITVDAARARGSASVTEGRVLADDVFLAVDTAVLDASMPPDGSGFSLREVKRIIDDIGNGRRIVGIGVFGLDPAQAASHLLAIAACQIALHAMDVAASASGGAT